MHGGQLRKIAEQFGVPQEKLLDFSANLNPDGPPESVIHALHKALNSAASLKEYPDSEYSELKRSFADYAGVSVEHLVVANGVIPLLGAALRAMNVKRCLLPVPCFSEYQRTLNSCGVETIAFRFRTGQDFRMKLDRICAEMKRRSCDSLLFANPQNPSGMALGKEELRAFLADASASGVYIFLDEAFIDYLPEESLAPEIAATSRVVILRSVTKFFALASMRVAFAITNPEIARKLENHIPEWPVTTLAAIAAQTALQDRQFALDTIEWNHRESFWLRDRLLSLGLEVYAGRANYLLFRLPGEYAGESIWRRLIAEHQIVVRSCGNFDSLDGRFLRAAIRKRAENQRLVDALRALLRETGSR